jgi:hypothetical protein
MEWNGKAVETRAISGLEILDINGNEIISLPVVFSKDVLPISQDDVVTRKEWANFEHLIDVPVAFINASVGLMFGANAPAAIKPLEIVSGLDNEPYASRHKLGWDLNGPLTAGCRKRVKVNRTQCEHNAIEKEIKKIV